MTSNLWPEALSKLTGKIKMGQTKLKVILLNYTQNPEHSVTHAAKLCYSPSSVEELRDKVEKSNNEEFIEQLLTMKHLSPLEHITFSFGIDGISRACSHQLVRHRIASYSQQSQRYVGLSSEKTFKFIIPPSIEAAGKRDWFLEKMHKIQQWYDELAEVLGGSDEKSNEDARFILPNAAETKIIVTMNARELIYFFSLRCCNRAQWEIRALATEMLKLVRNIAPNIFSKSGPNCLTGPCSEGNMCCGKNDEVKSEFQEMK